MLKLILLVISCNIYVGLLAAKDNYINCTFDKRALELSLDISQKFRSSINELCANQTKLDDKEKLKKINLIRNNAVTSQERFVLKLITDTGIFRSEKDFFMKGIDDIKKYLIADMYFFGININKNIEKAKMLYKGVHNDLKPLAFERLAIIYLGGIGVTRQPELSKKYLRESVKYTGSHASLYRLSLDFAENKNFENAILILTELSNVNYFPAIHELGVAYYLGNGVLKNEEKAISFFKKSAENNNVASQKYLAKVYFFKKKVDLAKHWMKRAADNGDLNAMFAYGDMLLRGKVSSGSHYDEAQKYLNKAFSLGYAPAAFNLALYNRLLYIKYKKCLYYKKALSNLNQLQKINFRIKKIDEEYLKLQQVDDKKCSEII
ncbi:tetratricopeptide repeat protein [Aliikangiella sp. IMCC44359]|uniref:tetratricopeptide repeat protein n=1 Tax=Aliikangiella sp. IMCC44359 TaxID=3459125 RepID=UPI00403AC17A